MIVFDLKCRFEHSFEAWFRSSSDYEDQRKRGFLSCPQCGDDNITKAVMAPNVGKKSNQKAEVNPSVKTTPQTETPTSQATTKPNASPATHENESPVGQSISPKQQAEVAAKAHALMQEFRQHVEQNSENVGDRFADEARAIHYGESEERGIYGTSSTEEVKELLDEGIEILPLPNKKRTDA